MRNYEIPHQRASMMAQESYQRYDEYEEDRYEDYEMENSEIDEEYEEEAPKPSKEEKDFLKLREKLKNQIREKMKTQTARTFGSSSHSQDKRSSTTNDTFGSFFGPSQPVIAQRVIEESRSIRETKHITANTSSSSANKRDPTSSVVRTGVSHQHSQRPKVVNEAKRKAQTLKDMRDYSFLFSDDADIPEIKDHPTHLPKKEQPSHFPKREQPIPRRVPAPKSDVQSAQVPARSKLPSFKPVSLSSIGNRVKNPVSAHVEDVQSAQVPARSKLPSFKPVSLSSIGNRVKNPVSAHVEDVQSAQVPARSKLPSFKPVSLSSIGNRVKNPVTSKQHLQTKTGSMKEVPARRPMLTSEESRKNVGVANRLKPVGNGALQQRATSQDTKINSMKKVVSNPSLKNNISSARQPHSSTQKNYPEQRKSAGVDRQKIALRQNMSSPKVQPSKQNSSHSIPTEQRKKRPVERNASDDEVDYRSLIRGMFRYNPNKYAQMDEDDSDMEVGFDVIQKEELRSSKIARKEDEEQLRLIEEEEERERQRRMKKKLKRG